MVIHRKRPLDGAPFAEPTGGEKEVELGLVVLRNALESYQQSRSLVKASFFLSLSTVALLLFFFFIFFSFFFWGGGGAISGVHKLRRTDGVPTCLTLLF